MHRYAVTVRWLGNRGEGTASYRAYGREHVMKVSGKADLLGSADPVYRGDASLHNPEDLFVGALSACHMLWFLHLASAAQIRVVDYVDQALGVLAIDEEGGGGEFQRIRLRPAVSVDGEVDLERIVALHDDAHARCFLSRSTRCPIEIEPTVQRADHLVPGRD